MLNAPHILETALLLLAVFLVGATVGSLARLAIRRLLRKPAAVAPAIAANPVTTAEPALVVAPVIEPLPNPASPVAPETLPALDFAETMMALATAPLPEIKMMPSIEPLPAVEGAEPVAKPVEPLLPARVAGETTSGRHIAAPHVQPAPEPFAVVTDTPSAEVIPFPGQPAPPNLTDGAAELESLLSLAVAADAEALKPDASESAVEPVFEEPLAEVVVPAVATDAESPPESPQVLSTTEGAAESPLEQPSTDEPVKTLAEAAAAVVIAAEADVEVSSDREVEAPLAGEALPPVAVDKVQPETTRHDADAVLEPLIAADEPVPAAEPQPVDAALEVMTEISAPEPELDTVEAVESAPEAVAVAVAPEPSHEAPSLPPAPKLSAEEEEAAAMRAIEGNWSPRRKAARAARPSVAPDGVIETADAALKASGAAVAAAAQAASAVVESAPDPNKPVGIAEPRQGGADDLTHIIGVLPIIETALNNLGIYHFDQVAGLGAAQIGWVETHLGMVGRIGREHWREQAKELALLGPLKVAVES